MYVQKQLVPRRSTLFIFDPPTFSLCLIFQLGFSIILESDPGNVASRVALRNDDIPLGEQTVAQVTRPFVFCFLFVCLFLF